MSTTGLRARSRASVSGGLRATKWSRPHPVELLGRDIASARVRDFIREQARELLVEAGIIFPLQHPSQSDETSPFAPGGKNKASAPLPRSKHPDPRGEARGGRGGGSPTVRSQTGQGLRPLKKDQSRFRTDGACTPTAQRVVNKAFRRGEAAPAAEPADCRERICAYPAMIRNSTLLFPAIPKNAPCSLGRDSSSQDIDVIEKFDSNESPLPAISENLPANGKLQGEPRSGDRFASDSLLSHAVGSL
jgi:hypothetical protein